SSPRAAGAAASSTRPAPGFKARRPAVGAAGLLVLWGRRLLFSVRATGQSLLGALTTAGCLRTIHSVRAAAKFRELARPNGCARNVFAAAPGRGADQRDI